MASLEEVKKWEKDFKEETDKDKQDKIREKIEEGKDAEYYQDVADNADDDATKACRKVFDKNYDDDNDNNITEEELEDKDKRLKELENKEKESENRLKELENKDLDDILEELKDKITELEEKKSSTTENEKKKSLTTEELKELKDKRDELEDEKVELKKLKDEKDKLDTLRKDTDLNNYKECKKKQELADTKQKIADDKQNKEQKKEDREQKKEDEEFDNSEHVATWDATSHINIKGFVPFEPYKAYKYRVLFAPISVTNGSMDDIKKSKLNTAILLGANAVLGFNEIKGISNETPAYSYNEGGENIFGNTFPMHTGAGDVTLSHGATRMPTMSLIRNMVSGSKDSICEFAQFHLIIFMYGKGLPQFWVLRNVWPTKIEIGGFSTDKKDKDNVIIESLTVSVERAEVEAVAITNAFKKNF